MVNVYHDRFPATELGILDRSLYRDEPNDAVGSPRI